MRAPVVNPGCEILGMAHTVLLPGAFTMCHLRGEKFKSKGFYVPMCYTWAMRRTTVEGYRLNLATWACAPIYMWVFSFFTSIRKIAGAARIEPASFGCLDNKPM